MKVRTEIGVLCGEKAAQPRGLRRAQDIRTDVRTCERSPAGRVEVRRRHRELAQSAVGLLHGIDAEGNKTPEFCGAT
eukprot:scaffold302_cov247-Pinguiococcus_pyrenoidosus.AAC.26